MLAKLLPPGFHIPRDPGKTPKPTGNSSSIRLPPSVSKQVAGYESAFSSQGDDRNVDSREADGDDELRRSPSPESDQDDDFGIPTENLRLSMLEVKSSVHQFAQTLISYLRTSPEKLFLLKLAEVEVGAEAEVDRAEHWEFLVQASVCKRLFAGFDTENGFFGIEHFDGLKLSRFSSFADFCKFKHKAATISELLAHDSADKSFLGKFCFQKFMLITGDLATNHPSPIFEEDWSTIAKERHPKSDFYQSFLTAAVSVWLLHRLVHSFEPQGWKMFGWDTYPPGSKLQKEFMEPVVPGLFGDSETEDPDQLNVAVRFVVLPGFQVGEIVVKCDVYPSSILSHQLGRVENIQIPVVSNQEDRKDRPASSSHVDGTSAHESSHGSTSTSISSTSTVSSGGFIKPSKPTGLFKVGSGGFDGRPHEIPEPFKAYRSSITLDHARPQVLPTRSSSSNSSGSGSSSIQDGPSKASPVYCKPSDSIIEDNVKKYTWDQVLHMTNDPTSRQLGKGGFGTVYLGKLENGKEVAVKILDRFSQQGTAEFLNEVNLLSRVHHKNLVRLVGYCQDEEQVLIYEFAEEGSIWDHLHGGRQWLDWRQRLNIALESACGLEYLHTSCSPRIIHRDVKSENILLTKTWAAKVSDFGLSRLGADQDNNWITHISTKVKGTRGYLDPEYHLTGQLRDSSDVYSFGVVLLEIITGRKPVPNSDPKCCITNWVEKTCSSGGSKALKAVADPLFSDNYDPRALKLVVNVARSCIRSSGESRPDISEVVRVLRKAQMLELEKKKSWFPFL